MKNTQQNLNLHRIFTNKMGKKILALGLLLSLVFSSFVQVISTGDHAEELLTLLKATHHQEKIFHPTSISEDFKTSFKTSFSRTECLLPNNFYLPFGNVIPIAELSTTFDDFGKEQLLTFLYPAHTFP